MDPAGQLRNLRDFLLVYNRMTEICFQKCTSNFNYRNLTMDEERCADSCAGKLIRSNHRLMGTYVNLMPAMVQRRMEEMESKAAEIAKATEAEGPVEHLSGGLNSSDAPSSVITSTSATPPPSVQTPTGTTATSGTIQSTPLLSKTEALGSPFPVPIITESAHTPAAEPTVVVSSRQTSLDVTSPHLEGLKVSTSPVNHSLPAQESLSSATAHQSTGGERPPS
ncbi:mitochondrial import inner membrane translocase subunit Tim10 B [Tachysurus ichikawai]